MTYSIGQVVPVTRRRGILGEELDAPVWYAPIVKAQDMRDFRDDMRALGQFAFYPSMLNRQRIRGKLIETERPIVTGHVYTRFTRRPNWDVMKFERRMILGASHVNGWPVAIHPDTIRHLQGMTVAAERLEAAKRDMIRIREGDRVRITKGPLSGMSGDVERTSDGSVWLNMIEGGIMGKNRIEVSKTLVVREVTDEERAALIAKAAELDMGEE
jgi:transcription antitermination factor NusG